MTTLKTAMICSAVAALAAAPALANPLVDSDDRNARVEMLDGNNDGQVSYNEFSNYAKTYGMSDADISSEFTRLSNGSSTISDADFASRNVENFMHTKFGGQWHSGHSQNASSQNMSKAGIKTAGTYAGTSYAEQNYASVPMSEGTLDSGFDDYDADRDGRLTFAEYSKMTRKAGVTPTMAAQRFVKMSRGQGTLDRTSFDSALAQGDMLFDRPLVDNVTYSPNTAVLGAGTAYQRPAYSSTRSITNSTGAPRATVQPMYRPSDRVGGDLTQTDNPMMDVRPGTVNGAISDSSDYNSLDYDEMTYGGATTRNGSSMID